MKSLLIILPNGKAATLRVADDAAEAAAMATFPDNTPIEQGQPGEVLCVDENGGIVRYPNLQALPDFMQQADFNGLDRIFILDGDTGTYNEWAGGIDSPILVPVKDYPMRTPGQSS